MNAQHERSAVNLTKEHTGSLGSVAFRRTRHETDPDPLLTAPDGVGHGTAAPPAVSERTFISGSHPRRPTLVPCGKSGLGSRAMSRPPEQPTYKLGPDARFSSSTVEGLVQEVFVRRLRDVSYEPTTCKALSQEMAATIMEELKALHIRRYKMMAVVSIGSLSERPGLQFGSRCLWDDATDSFASVKFTNGSLFAVAMIYGLYYA